MYGKSLLDEYDVVLMPIVESLRAQGFDDISERVWHCRSAISSAAMFDETGNTEEARGAARSALRRLFHAAKLVFALPIDSARAFASSMDALMATTDIWMLYWCGVSFD